MAERNARRQSWTRGFFVRCAMAWLVLSSLAMASEYHGQVTMGGLPVPGVTVTAVQGTKKVTAVTDAQGIYSFADLADGAWTIDIEMTGFAPIKQDVAVAKDVTPGAFELKLLSIDEIRAAVKPVVVEASAAPVVSAAASGPSTPGLPAAPAPAAATSKAAGGSGASAPAKGGAAKGGAAASGGAAGAGAAAPTEAAAAVPEDPSVSTGLLINGSQNNAATSPFSLAPAFGNTRNGGRRLYNGGIGFRLDNSALDAKNFSVTGQDTAKPAYNQMTGMVTLVGPINIPRLMPRGPTLSLNYAWTRNGTDTTQQALVPTAQEEMGNLSQALGTNTIIVPAASDLPAACLATPGITPGSPFPGNVIPAACISPQAQALLNQNFYPAPNVSGGQYNYQTALVSSTHSDAFNSRVEKSWGARNDVWGTFAITSTRSSNTNLFNFVDPSDSLGMSTDVNWSHRYGQRLFVVLEYTFSRQRTRQSNFFGNRQNIELEDNINGAATSPPNVDPGDFGPPSLSFSSIAGLSDGNSALTRNETNAYSEQTTWNHGHHYLAWGANFRRQEFNYLSQLNPRGTLGFTGAATQALGVNGADFADFLLGIPDTSSIAFGNADKYFRGSYYGAYLDDDWRARPELTVHAGVHWEYGAPVTELKGRLVNLDVLPGFTQVQAVLGSNPVGPLTGQQYPTSLLRPDKHGFEPRVGVSWRPISGSSLVLKAGYGIGFDTSVYAGIANNMGQQAPLSTSLNATNSPSCFFTMASPFKLPCTTATTDTFGIDPNFRIGYAQNWQLSAQRDLPFSLQLTATYLGVKGTRAVQQFYPNTSAPPTTEGSSPPAQCIGASCPPSGFYYRESNGDSNREAGQVQLRRRPRAGFQATVAYTYSKALDDVSGFGGQGGSSAQNWQNLRGERGLSTFDQRNLLSVNAQYTTGMGIGGKTLLSGWRGVLYKQWLVLTNISYGSGLPETPIYPGSLVGAACSCLRPDVTGAPIHLVSGNTFLNPAAFAAPASGFGDARRDSITGPTQFSLSASMQRSFRLHDRYNLDFSLNTTNTLNHVSYSSWVSTYGSPTFGAPTGAGQMRKVVAQMRLRF
jgi:carboxypeptidase family protein